MKYETFLTQELLDLVDNARARSTWLTVGLPIAMLSLMIALTGAVPWKEQVLLNVRLLPAESAMPVVAPGSGEVIRLFRADKDPVDTGQVLAIVGDRRRYESISRIRAAAAATLEAAKGSGDVPELPQQSIPDELQPYYADLQSRIVEYQTLRDDRSAALKLRDHAQRARDLSRNLSYLGAQVILSEHATAIATDKMNRIEQLMDAGWMSPRYAADVKQQVNDKQRAENSARLALAQAEGEIRGLSRDGDEDRAGRKTELARSDSAVRSSAIALLDKLAWYEEQFAVRAPRSGRIVFDAPLKPGDTIPPGRRIGLVSARSDLTAVGLVKFDSAGTVRPGQEVAVEIPSYPKARYGALNGVVTHVGSVEQDAGYLVEMTFPEGLVTDRGAAIPTRINLAGRASVTVGRSQLLIRLAQSLHLTGGEHQTITKERE